MNTIKRTKTPQRFSYCGIGVESELKWFGIPRTGTQSTKSSLQRIQSYNSKRKFELSLGFTVIRDPYDRFKSAIRGCGGVYRSKDKHNNDIINWDSLIIKKDEHFLPQHKFKFHSYTECPIVYFYYHDNILNDIFAFLKSRGVKIKKTELNKIQRLNATKQMDEDDDFEYYLWQNRKRIYDMYLDDYKFIDSLTFWNRPS